MVKKVIVFTGGGSGGHVIPAITLIKNLRSDFPSVSIRYIGGINGIESQLIRNVEVPYKAIYTGKLRRYFSVENFFDIFKLLVGMVQSFLYLMKFSKKNCLIFSTGGFVSVPVVIAGFLTGKKVFIHEQTSRVGLANRISSLFADKVFISFESSKRYFKSDQVVFSGYPLRDECFQSFIKRDEICGIDIKQNEKPILFATGGGNGSLLINNLILKNKEELQKRFTIFHQVGKNFKKDFEALNCSDYQSFDFLDEGIVDLFKASSIVISRAGAGTVSELLALKKPSLFIPLKIAQKNEQFHNAMEAKNKCGSEIIEEDVLDADTFFRSISKLENNVADRMNLADEEPGIKKKENKAKDLIFNEIGNALKIR